MSLDSLMRNASSVPLPTGSADTVLANSAAAFQLAQTRPPVTERVPDTVQELLRRNGVQSLTVEGGELVGRNAAGKAIGQEGIEKLLGAAAKGGVLTKVLGKVLGAAGVLADVVGSPEAAGSPRADRFVAAGAVAGSLVKAFPDDLVMTRGRNGQLTGVENKNTGVSVLTVDAQGAVRLNPNLNPDGSFTALSAKPPAAGNPLAPGGTGRPQGAAQSSAASPAASPSATQYVRQAAAHMIAGLKSQGEATPSQVDLEKALNTWLRQKVGANASAAETGKALTALLQPGADGARQNVAQAIIDTARGGSAPSTNAQGGPTIKPQPVPGPIPQPVLPDDLPTKTRPQPVLPDNLPSRTNPQPVFPDKLGEPLPVIPEKYPIQLPGKVGEPQEVPTVAKPRPPAEGGQGTPPAQGGATPSATPPATDAAGGNGGATRPPATTAAPGALPPDDNSSALAPIPGVTGSGSASGATPASPMTPAAGSAAGPFERARQLWQDFQTTLEGDPNLALRQRALDHQKTAGNITPSSNPYGFTAGPDGVSLRTRDDYRAGQIRKAGNELVGIPGKLGQGDFAGAVNSWNQGVKAGVTAITVDANAAYNAATGRLTNAVTSTPAGSVALELTDVSVGIMKDGVAFSKDLIFNDVTKTAWKVGMSASAVAVIGNVVQGNYQAFLTTDPRSDVPVAAKTGNWPRTNVVGAGIDMNDATGSFFPATIGVYAAGPHAKEGIPNYRAGSLSTSGQFTKNPTYLQTNSYSAGEMGGIYTFGSEGLGIYASASIRFGVQTNPPAASLTDSKLGDGKTVSLPAGGALVAAGPAFGLILGARIGDKMPAFRMAVGSSLLSGNTSTGVGGSGSYVSPNYVVFDNPVWKGSKDEKVFSNFLANLQNYIDGVGKPPAPAPAPPPFGPQPPPVP